MSKLFNLARVTTATVGTGTITLGAAVSGFLTFAQAGAGDGDVVTYSINDGANCEIGVGTYTASGTTLSRDVVLRSTGAGNTAAISLSGSAQVAIDTPAEALDFARPNILINGAMEIDQANEGAVVTNPGGGAYVVDCWKAYSSQAGAGPATLNHIRDTQFSTLPQYANSLRSYVGAAAYTGATQAGDYWLLRQMVEANDLIDAALGTAGAQPLAVSFFLRTTVTGNWGVTLNNSAANRSYVTMVSTVANTWKFCTIRVPGDIAGTWVTSGVGIGLQLTIALACGSTYQGTAGSWQAANNLSSSTQTQLWATANAAANLTGAKLEIGNTSTPFKRLPYQQEMARCERLLEKSYDPGTAFGSATFNGCVVNNIDTTGSYGTYLPIRYRIPKRANPSLTLFSPNTGAAGKGYNGGTAADFTWTQVNWSGPNGATAQGPVIAMTQSFPLMSHYVADARF